MATVADVSRDDQENAGQDQVPAMRATSQPEPDSETEHDPELEARESELTRDVPNLLDSLNRASSEVNILEAQSGEAQARYKKLLEQWSRLYEDLRVQYGSSIDKARPYFDAATALSSASQHVQGVVREFSCAVSQHTQAKQDLRAIEERLAYGAHKVVLDKEQQSSLSSATVRVLKCQQERDRSEQEYAKALREYQDAQETAEAKRAQVGDSVIRRALPCFRQLQQHQQELDRERRRLGELEERHKSAKSLYTSSMRGLEKINVAVHNARREFHEERESSNSPSKSSRQSLQSPKNECKETHCTEEACSETPSPSSPHEAPVEPARGDIQDVEREVAQDGTLPRTEENDEGAPMVKPPASEKTSDEEELQAKHDSSEGCEAPAKQVESSPKLSPRAAG